MSRSVPDRLRRRLVLVVLPVLVALLGSTCHEEPGYQTFASPQSNPLALSPDGSRLYVANTTSGSVDVISTASNHVQGSIAVGIDPVAVAVRPDGDEVWVSNHVSDSVSVIDTAPGSDTRYQVIATIQSLGANQVTDFDEPVGIAFASSAKAYVALSSTNRVAVVDAATHQVTGTLPITAQDPRALAVRDGLLYVAAFETGNQSELSACPNGGSAPQCTLSAAELIGFAVNPNLPNSIKNIVIDPDVPDRDLFVFDTASDTLVEAVTGVGTLLYGIAVDGAGQAWVAQTDARNADNGLEGENLIDLDNRLFLNQIARVACTAGGCGAPAVFELEPAPPAQPSPGTALATPYGIQVSDDDSTLVVTAAASSRIFTFETGTQTVQGILDVGAIPRGVALRSNASTGAPQTAYVLNTLGNDVTVVDVQSPGSPSVLATISVGNDPTREEVRLGRIAFNDANGSSSGTFACASCHPDGNTDQLLWRIGGACSFGTCSGNDEPRSTMPVRGLKNTLPLHWDGTLGDPFGGPNGDVGTGGSSAANCTIEESCFRQLVDASLSGVMCDQTGGCAGGGELSEAERDDMGEFLASVSYPPARERRPDDVVSANALDGFSDFFVDQGGIGGAISTCADGDSGCHALPLGASTNSPVVGAFDAPTMRGLNDRFLQFSLGISNPEEVQVDAAQGWNPALGLEEDVVFANAFPNIFTPVYNVGSDDIFQMVHEASTGFSGAAGRQVTLSQATTMGGNLAATEAIVAALEAADARGVVNLRARGLRDFGEGLVPAVYSYSTSDDDYQGSDVQTRAELIALVQAGYALLTLTAELRSFVGDLASSPQPLLAPSSTGGGPTGNPALPVIATSGSPSMTLTGIDVLGSPQIFVDGQLVSGSVACNGGTFSPSCTSEVVEITLDAAPAAGLHLLQVQNPRALLSNEMPICSGSAGQCM